MIKTYFFVPLTNARFILKAQYLDADYLVYDLEDAISKQSTDVATNNLSLINNYSNCFIRPKIDWNKPNFQEIEGLFQQGFQGFVIPKAESFQHIELLINSFPEKNSNFKIILLVENPRLLFELPEIIKKYSDCLVGLSLGSHDYCNFMGAKHEYKSYQFVHNYILNLCKSFNIEAIDIASMHINDRESFISEVKTGFDKGYRSKFILHPSQLEYLKTIEYFDDKEITFARLVENTINLENDFDAIKVGGKILEKPHIDRIKEILKYSNDGTS